MIFTKKLRANSCREISLTILVWLLSLAVLAQNIIIQIYHIELKLIHCSVLMLTFVTEKCEKCILNRIFGSYLVGGRKGDYVMKGFIIGLYLSDKLRVSKI
jgi:hypothetical protein